jgi:glycosyltransferase involved in cell wall biosynthesis
VDGAFELAAAFGKPVVVSDAGGLSEAFSRYGYGSVVPPRNAPELARALLGPYRPARLDDGRNTWSTVAASTEAVYREVLGG